MKQNKPPLLFELVDATDEQYFTLGLWVHQSEALQALQSIADPNDVTEGDHDDVAVFELRARTLGWGDSGRVWIRVRWMLEYDEPKDDYAWKKKLSFFSLSAHEKPPATTSQFGL